MKTEILENLKEHYALLDERYGQMLNQCYEMKDFKYDPGHEYFDVKEKRKIVIDNFSTLFFDFHASLILLSMHVANTRFDDEVKKIKRLVDAIMDQYDDKKLHVTQMTLADITSNLSMIFEIAKIHFLQCQAILSEKKSSDILSERVNHLEKQVAELQAKPVKENTSPARSTLFSKSF